jgi:membrane-bound lytic murein transglycosylase D
VAALRQGNAGAADQEFRTALSLLMDPAAVTPLRASYRPPRQTLPADLLRWQEQPKNPRADSDEGTEEGDDPEAEEGDSIPSAPALVTPEDVQAVEREANALAGAAEIESQGFDVPIAVNEQVRAFLHYFSTRKFDLVGRAFERASGYLPMMREIFRERGLPQSLLNLAFIESAFNPRARSHAGATGIWQFVEGTGRRFGMRSGFWVDQRRDPELSTRGAADYLKTLYEMFGDWALALAAYNAGEGKIQQAITRQRTTDFWKLRLPKETQLFVPAFMAMTIISKDPTKYGFSPPPEHTPKVDTVHLKESIEIRVIARAAQASPETIRHLNPTLLRGATPPAPFVLRLPPGSGEGFLDRLAQLPRAHRLAWTQHRVKRGDTWRTLARRHKVPVGVLLELNAKHQAGPLKVGSTVLVPGRGEVAAAAGVAPSGGGAGGRRPAADGQARAKEYTVKPGDTLGRIARAHRVRLEDLQRWNGLTARAGLKPGQVLVVQAPQRTAAIEADHPKPAQPGGRAPASKESAQAKGGRQAAASNAPRKVRYTVKPGDSLWTIAQSYGVRPEEVRRWNGLKARARLQPGQELQIILPEPS